MTRMPRIDVAGVPQHVVQRGNNRKSHASSMTRTDSGTWAPCATR
jgi:hypothetical protein